MKKLLATLLLVLAGCAVTEPIQGPTQPLPPTKSGSFDTHIITLCNIKSNDQFTTVMNCRFDNESYTVSSLCVKLAFMDDRSYSQYFLTDPICSGDLSYGDSSIGSLLISSTNHTQLIKACGNDLENCYFGIFPLPEQEKF